MSPQLCRSSRAILASLLLLPLFAAPLAAQEERADVKVASLEFTGVEGVDESALRSVLATQAPGWLPWSDKPSFDRAQFEADLQRIRAFYVDRGFPDARVSSFDVELNEAGTEVDLKINVEEGEPTRVTGLDLRGFDALTEAELRGLRRELPLEVGERFDRAAVATSREVLAGALRDHGYPYPRITAQVEKGATEHEVSVVFTAETGAKAYFGETRVQGETSVGEGFIRRSLLFKPGDVYEQSKVQETQRKLYGLELFQFVNVTPLRDPAEGSPGQGKASPGDEGRRTIPMQVIVTESSHNRVRGSLGYGSEEKARVEGQYRKLNFLGGGRSAGIHAKYSALDRGVRFNFQQPFIFGPRWSLSFSSQRWYSDEPAYYAIQSGGFVTVQYGPGLQTSFSLTASTFFDSSRITRQALEDLSLRPVLITLGLDPRTGGQDGTLNALSFDFRRNTAEPSLLNAVRGYSVDLHLERALAVLTGSYSYNNVSLDVRSYQRIYGSVVAAARVQAGWIAPTSGLSANVPFSKRYFLGGADSLRGWGRYEVSPLSGSGLPLGGFSMFQFTAEARVPLFGDLSAVAFLDAGNVWSGDWTLRAGDLRYDVGPGLRYNTPIGPIRVDLGYQLNPLPNLLVDGEPESRRWRLHFSIGQAF